MKISRIITLIIVLTLLLIQGSIYLGLHQLLVNEFNELDRTSAERNITRLQEAYKAELRQLTQKVRDWSEWDDTYLYIANKNPGYEDKNITYQSLSAIGVDTVAFYDQKQFLSGKSVHDGKMVNIAPELLTKLNKYMQNKPALQYKEGLLFDGKRYYLMIERPILTSEGQGPINGTLVFIEEFNQSFIARLKKLTSLALEFNSHELSINGKDNKRLSDAEQFDSVTDLSNNMLISQIKLMTIDEQDSMVVSVTQSREIFNLGEGIEVKIFSYLILGAAFFAVCVLLILNSYISKRLKRLSGNLKLIGDAKYRVGHVLVEGSDEIAEVAISCNNMLNKLDAMYQEQGDLDVRQQKQHSALLNLAKSDHLTSEELVHAARHINETLCIGTGAARSGVWYCMDNNVSMYCLDIFHAPDQHHQQGFSLPYQLIRGRYEQLKGLDNKPLVINDSYELSRFSTMLAKLGLESLAGQIVMAPIYHDDSLFGFIIAELEGSEETWYQDELSYIHCVCDFSAQTLITLSKLQQFRAGDGDDE